MAPTKQEILATSAGWVAVSLNVAPGLGAGYLYQRRWKAYWITSALATAWLVLGAALGQDAGAGEGASKPIGWTRRACGVGSRNGSRGWLGSEESSFSGLSHYPALRKFRRRGHGGSWVHAHTQMGLRNFCRHLNGLPKTPVLFRSALLPGPSRSY